MSLRLISGPLNINCVNKYDFQTQKQIWFSSPNAKWETYFITYVQQMINNPSILVALQFGDLCGLFGKDRNTIFAMVSFYLFILYRQDYSNSLLCVFRSMVHPNIYINIYHLNISNLHSVQHCPISSIKYGIFWNIYDVIGFFSLLFFLWVYFVSTTVNSLTLLWLREP